MVQLLEKPLLNWSLLAYCKSIESTYGESQLKMYPVTSGLPMLHLFDVFAIILMEKILGHVTSGKNCLE